VWGFGGGEKLNECPARADINPRDETILSEGKNKYLKKKKNYSPKGQAVGSLVKKLEFERQEDPVHQGLQSEILEFKGRKKHNRNEATGKDLLGLPTGWAHGGRRKKREKPPKGS